MPSSQRIRDDNSILLYGFELGLNPNHARNRCRLLRNGSIEKRDFGLDLTSAARKIGERNLFNVVTSRLLRPVSPPWNRYLQPLARLRKSNVRQTVTLCELAHWL